MINWYAIKINSEKEFNEILSILKPFMGVVFENLSYSDFPNIKYLFFGKSGDALKIEWSGLSSGNLLPGEQIIFKSELNQTIEYLKLSLHESGDQD